MNDAERAEEAYAIYRDATFSLETRERLLVIEQFMVALLLDVNGIGRCRLLPQYMEVDVSMSLAALRDVMEKWDGNEATEIVL